MIRNNIKEISFQSLQKSSTKAKNTWVRELLKSTRTRQRSDLPLPYHILLGADIRVTRTVVHPFITAGIAVWQVVCSPITCFWVRLHSVAAWESVFYNSLMWLDLLDRNWKISRCTYVHMCVGVRLCTCVFVCVRVGVSEYLSTHRLKSRCWCFCVHFT